MSTQPPPTAAAAAQHGQEPWPQPGSSAAQQGIPAGWDHSAGAAAAAVLEPGAGFADQSEPDFWQSSDDHAPALAAAEAAALPSHQGASDVHQYEQEHLQHQQHSSIAQDSGDWDDWGGPAQPQPEQHMSAAQPAHVAESASNGVHAAVNDADESWWDDDTWSPGQTGGPGLAGKPAGAAQPAAPAFAGGASWDDDWEDDGGSGWV